MEQMPYFVYTSTRVCLPVLSKFSNIIYRICMKIFIIETRKQPKIRTKIIG